MIAASGLLCDRQKGFQKINRRDLHEVCANYVALPQQARVKVGLAQQLCCLTLLAPLQALTCRW